MAVRTITAPLSSGTRLLVAGLVALAFSSACTDPPDTTSVGRAAPRLLLIGLDGADLGLVDQLSAEERLPHLTKLMEKGVSARLQTVSNASPVVWTSIATGVQPERHGITGFRKDGQLVAATMRQRPAFWNILSHYGRSVGVLAWWATFPAEAIEGFLVSPYVKFRAPKGDQTRVGDLWSRPDPRKTHPSSLFAEIAPKMRTEADIDTAKISDVYADGGRSVNTPWVVARDDSYLDIALDLAPRLPVETLATYYQGIDVASHDLTRWVFGKNINMRRPPRVSSDEVDAAMARVYAMYERVDGLVGRTLSLVDEGTDVIVVSDHGWRYDGTSHLNRNAGTFIASGPSFRPAGRQPDVSVIDILPLMLRILGLPVATALDGAVPESLLTGAVPAAQTVEDYPIPPVALDEGVSAKAAEDTPMTERLRSLGYIE